MGDGEEGIGELDLTLSSTNITANQSMFVNVTLRIENTTGNVTIHVDDPDGLPVFVEASKLINGNASFEFILPVWFPNGTYYVYATVRTDSGETYNSTIERFDFVNWTSGPAPDENGTGMEIPPLFMIVSCFLTAGLLIAATDRGRYMLWLFIMPLYTRIRKDQTLDAENRLHIYNKIVEKPGIRRVTLKRSLDLENGVLSYHLNVLTRMDFIRAVGDKTHKHFYPKGVQIEGSRKFKHLNTDQPLSQLQASIVTYLQMNGWSTQNSLKTMIGVTQAAISTNLKRMMTDTIVQRRLEGNVYIYDLTNTYRTWLTSGSSRLCTNCGHSYEPWNKFCPNCGTNLRKT